MKKLMLILVLLGAFSGASVAQNGANGIYSFTGVKAKFTFQVLGMIDTEYRPQYKNPVGADLALYNSINAQVTAAGANSATTLYNLVNVPAKYTIAMSREYLTDAGMKAKALVETAKEFGPYLMQIDAQNPNGIVQLLQMNNFGGQLTKAQILNFYQSN